MNRKPINRPLNQRWIPGTQVDGAGISALKGMSQMLPNGDLQISAETGFNPESGRRITGNTTPVRHTVQDPYIAWFLIPDELRMDHPRLLENEQICRQVAAKHQFTTVIIRKEAHNTRYAWNGDGTRRTFTLKTGQVSLRSMQLAGHVYVSWPEDECHRKVGFMRIMENPERERRFRNPGEKPTSEEYWLLPCTSVNSRTPRKRW
ncbi:hypothetical protein B0T22DRAFT_485628 [Podospora appendiculata]|uniref:Uncharacterized protein n=1 Tax=Podospora appendiculata TaxID=314037 RepID=A0AAE0WZ33_9PEZI|nr:hypothetical protein B0T22DRAFT_485628 [Podospora appendiculata]